MGSHKVRDADTFGKALTLKKAGQLTITAKKQAWAIRHRCSLILELELEDELGFGLGLRIGLEKLRME